MLGDNIKTDPLEVECEAASWLKIRSNRVCYNTAKCLSFVKTPSFLTSELTCTCI
jgi:hypothetical protein